MNELAKIRDVSIKYGVSARTLRYYEDLGLIKSIREADYAYRLYDYSELKRLEQILALRKLSISIKDIQTIFKCNDINILLDVLGKKITDIDEETASLYELKQIVQEFINQIKQNQSMDAKELYDRITRLEQNMKESEVLDQACNSEDSLENNSDLTIKSIEVLGQTGNLNVRLISIPACKMVTSGLGIFGEDERFDRFDKWFMEASKLNTDKWQMPLDFMWFDPERGGTEWWYVKFAEDLDTGAFEVIDYEGGLYAAAVSRDGDDEDGNRVYNGIKKWINDNEKLELDERSGHFTMFHIITSEKEKELLGYHQLEIFVPVKMK